MNNRFYIVFIFLLIASNLLGSDWQAKKENGDTAYQKKDYQTAIQSYESAVKLLGKEKASSDLYFNLGNAHYKNKALAQSILYYEKALLLNANDKDIQFNLDIAKEEIKGEVIPIRPFVLLKWWNKIKMSFTSFTWSLIGLFFLWLGVSGLLGWMFLKERKQKKYSFLVGCISLCLSIIPFIFSFQKSSIEFDSKRAIYMEKETPLRNAPDGTGEFIIHEGTEMEILDRIGEWSKVRLLNSDVGWVKNKEIEKI